MLARLENGNPALIASDGHHYLACWPDEALLTSTLKLLCGKAGLSLIELPPHIRLRRRGGLLFAFNYGEESWSAPGGAVVQPQDIAILRQG